jgi:ABC-type polysaccharide/polyol phosphate transport system ATPase subunit
MSIIEVDHLTKEYNLGQLHGIRRSVQNLLARMNGVRPEPRQGFKALNDVTFNIAEGEVVGVIGHNGSGKSTLLKLLSRITVPSGGSVRVRGSVAPLIEVGAGLVGELTGRENIYLNALILGMPRKVVRRKFDEIVAFAELEQFVDTPVKRYSSGMAVRLGFSIATSVDADVLIIDEVLAVGDLAFQRKCFDRMEEMIHRNGKTVLLVSHNIRQVERMCTRVILLDHGRMVSDGDAKSVCNQFYDLMDRKVHAHIMQAAVPDSWNRVRSSGTFSLERLTLLNAASVPVEEIAQGSTVVFEMVCTTMKRLRRPVFAVGIHTTDFIYLATARSARDVEVDEIPPGRFKLRCKITDLSLMPGTYATRVSVSEGEIPSTIFYAENLFPFRVLNVEFERSMIAAEGLVAVRSSWSEPEQLSLSHTQPGSQNQACGSIR